MVKLQVTVRLDKDQVIREREALRVRTVAEPIERALTFPTEKATPRRNEPHARRASG